MEQKSAKAAARRVCLAKAFLLEKVGEELLGEVLGILRTVTATTDENVKRIPIGATKLLQGRGALRSNHICRRQDDTPMRGGKKRLCHRAWGFHFFLPRHGLEANPAALNHKLKSFPGSTLVYAAWSDSPEAGASAGWNFRDSHSLRQKSFVSSSVFFRQSGQIP